MEGCFTFQLRGGGSDGGASFLSGGVPHRGGTCFDVGGFEKNRGIGGGGAPHPHAPYYGKHWRIRMKI